MIRVAVIILDYAFPVGCIVFFTSPPKLRNTLGGKRWPLAPPSVLGCWGGGGAWARRGVHKMKPFEQRKFTKKTTPNKANQSPSQPIPTIAHTNQTKSLHTQTTHTDVEIMSVTIAWHQGKP